MHIIVDSSLLYRDTNIYRTESLTSFWPWCGIGILYFRVLEVLLSTDDGIGPCFCIRFSTFEQWSTYHLRRTPLSTKARSQMGSNLRVEDAVPIPEAVLRALVCSAQIFLIIMAKPYVTGRTSTSALITTVSSQTAYDLSIPELLRVLSDKIGLEYTRVQETSLPPDVSTTSLETEVSTS